MQVALSDTWVPGIYHYSNEGDITWFQLADAIREITGSPCKVIPIPTSEYPTPAKRPLYSVMRKDKICRTYGIQLVPWRDSLRDCLNMLKAGE
jgi:dTDP-4-dehydrorhamnose reductase